MEIPSLFRFDGTSWRAVRDPHGAVHYGTPLSKKEAAYLFRLADTVRAIAPCGACRAVEGAWCVRKRDGQPRMNHSHRVQQARLLFEQRVLPRLDQLNQALCSATHIIFGPAADQAVDCMSCLVAAARQGG